MSQAGAAATLRVRMSTGPTHLVLIPSYNTGAALTSTVQAALAAWPDVWVVVDGSTDGSAEPLRRLVERDGRLRLICRPQNGGKGAAVATGLASALRAGYTHALVMDADGQHPAEQIRPFMEASQAEPEAMILGRPVFGPEAPLERLYGRKLSIGMTHLETLGRAIADPLFGFRVYPIVPLLRVMQETSGARGYDFDPEVAVRLYWAGVRPINRPATCRYLSRAEGGVSHFHYLRDNVKMVRLHLRLLAELLLWRWPQVRRLRHRNAEPRPPGPVPTGV